MAASNIRVQRESKKRKKLLPVGYKINRPLDLAKEFLEIRTALMRQKELLREEKVEIDKLLISAEWDPVMNEVRVVKVRGNSLTVFGHGMNRLTYLYPEEALYLIEMNKLQLFYNCVRLSVHRAYTLLLNSVTNNTLDRYRIFKHFVVYGYKLFRHQKRPTNESENASYNIVETDTTSSIYGNHCKNLRIFHSANTNGIVSDSSLEIAYDVYNPLTTVPKSCRPNPDYYLIIIRDQKNMDSLFQFVSSFNQANFLFAQVSGNSISVFNMQDSHSANLFKSNETKK